MSHLLLKGFTATEIGTGRVYVVEALRGIVRGYLCFMFYVLNKCFCDVNWHAESRCDILIICQVRKKSYTCILSGIEQFSIECRK